MSRPVRTILGGVTLAIVAALGLLAAFQFFGTGADGLTSGSPTGDGPPFTAPTGDPTSISEERITVSASSHLQPDGDITYDPGNLIDGDLDTAWNSDTGTNDGTGETLTFRFSEPVDLKRVRFVNGYAKNDGVYQANHRIRELLISTDGSPTPQPVNLLDTTDRQEIAADFGLTTKVVLEVVEVYTGDGFDNPELTTDLALTEVTFIAVQP